MSRISELSKESRKGGEAFERIDIAEYTNRTFGMFGGETQIVTLKLPEELIGVILDRFGKETDIRKLAENMVSVRVRVTVSMQFYGWITGLGGKVVISGPDDVREGYREYLSKILQNY